MLSARQTPHLSVFSFFSYKGSSANSIRLLGFSSIEIQSSLGLEEHFKYMCFVHKLFDYPCANLESIIADNFNTN